jgi:hypothetical protein
MIIKTTSKQLNDMCRSLDNAANQLSFINHALIAIGNHAGGDALVSEELCGLQDILFTIESNVRSADDFLYDNLTASPSEIPEEAKRPI